jgi:hypothetical protein
MLICIQNYELILYVHSNIHGMAAFLITQVYNLSTAEYQVYCYGEYSAAAV